MEPWMITAIVGLVSAVLGSGGVAAFLNYKSKTREQNSVDFREFIKIQKADIEDKNKRIETLENNQEALSEEIDALKGELAYFKAQFLMMESLHMDLPLPQWVKAKDGIMLSLNPKYEEEFLIPNGKVSMDYIGKHDTEVWGLNVGSEYWGNDLEVIRTKKERHVIETVVIDGKEVYWQIFKYPVKQGNRVVAVGGIAYAKTTDKPESAPKGFYNLD